MSTPRTTYLGQKGYTLTKDEFPPDELDALKRELVARPASGIVTAAPVTFPIYRESTKKLYVPRYFGEDRFGPPQTVNVPDGDRIDVPFRGTLRDAQVPAVEAYFDHVAKGAASGHAAGLLELHCAAGKCLGRDQAVLMYDGTLKKAQDIRVGDCLMGDDSTPRTVLSTCSGTEQMYRIHDPYGDSYTCNESHILSLKWMKNRHQTQKDRVWDISLRTYLTLPRTYRGPLSPLYGYRVPVTFPPRQVFWDPFLVGFMHACSGELRLNPWKLLHFTCLFRTRHPTLRLRHVDGDMYTIHSLESTCHPALPKCTDALPPEYVINCPEIQYQVLMGVLVACGRPTGASTVAVTGAGEALLAQYQFIGRCLGLLCCRETSGALVITGEAVDDLMHGPRLRTRERRRTWKPSVLAYRLRVERTGMGTYYGFHIDGNRRFVLGDFTVTHNTVMSLNILSRLQRKTLIVVNKEFLLNQWIERIGEFLPTARVGKIQGKVVDVDGKDIVIGMLQSLSMKDYPPATFAGFGFAILDEVHHISSEVFSQAMFKIVTKYMLGLSATMERKDGTTPVIKMFLGDVVYHAASHDTHDVLVRKVEYRTADTEFNATDYDFRGNPQYSKMIVKLCDYGPRSDFIVGLVADIFAEDPTRTRQVMILGHNRSLLTYLHDAIAARGFATVGYYVGGMKQKDLQATETQQVVVATYSMAAEALDIKTLNTLVLVTPKTDVVQAVGRILRQKHTQPIIVDVVDQHQLFQNQWHKRRRYYQSCGYKIATIDSASYVKQKAEGKAVAWKASKPPPASSKGAGASIWAANSGMDPDAPPKCLISVAGL